MSITSTDIHYRLSGGASNTNPTASIGGAKSSTDAGANIFTDVSSIDAGAGEVDYRCVYVHNAHASLTLIGANLTVPANTPSPTTDIAVGIGASALNGTEAAVVDVHTAPAGVTFGSSAALGDIPAGQSRAVWVRRTVNAGTAAAADTFTLRVTGDTA
jgi:hypothetical protein